MSSPTLKRKRTIPKFYSVRTGHKPGIYSTWDECKAQTQGFKGAIYKSFTSLSDAEQHLAGLNASKKFYAVKSGKRPGIYKDWVSAKAQIDGWPKPQHKCFSTEAEAKQFLDGRDPSDTKVEPNDEHEDGFDPTIVLDGPSGKITTKTPLQLQATKLRAGAATDTYIKVHTDGSSLGNGKKDAFAGVGVYFGPGDQRNISEPLQGARQTNQRAELTAVQRALEQLPRDRHVEIITDSQYSIKCVTEWSRNWRRNGWRNSAGKAVENRDLVEAILHKMDQRLKEGAHTRFTWVKGHATDEGNIGADRLAVGGARIAAELAGDANFDV